MAVVELRTVRVLVPGRGDTVLVGPNGSIPVRQVSVDGETTVAAVRRQLLPEFGHPGPIIDCYIVQPDDDADPAVPVAVLLELAQPADDWNPPDHHRWERIYDVTFELEPGLAPLLFESLDVRRGLRAPDPLRPKWTAPDWLERVSAWIRRTLADSGRSVATEIVQYRHWGISALLQVATPDRRYWFKAVFPHFGHEPALTAMLDRMFPGAVARVVGFDADEGWILMEHIEVDDGARGRPHCASRPGRPTRRPAASVHRRTDRRSDGGRMRGPAARSPARCIRLGDRRSCDPSVGRRRAGPDRRHHRVVARRGARNRRRRRARHARAWRLPSRQRGHVGRAACHLRLVRCRLLAPADRRRCLVVVAEGQRRRDASALGFVLRGVGRRTVDRRHARPAVDVRGRRRRLPLS